MLISDKKLFFISLLLLILLITLDTIFKINSFYYFYPNTDIFMHLLGGFSITTLAISILRDIKMDNNINILLFIFFVSIFWEYIEFYLGKNIYINSNFLIDTIVDLLMNALGGIISYICFYKIQIQKKPKI